MSGQYDDILTGQAPAIRVTAMPADANPAGDIFGGWLMSQVDLAAGVVAGQRARGRVATVAVNAFAFQAPVFVGDLVSCYGRVVRVGRTSLTIQVEAYARRSDGQEVRVTEATLTFVALDEHRRPRPVPPDPA